MHKFSPKVREQLKYYVYLYIDPRNEHVFYVGKGKGNRAFSHMNNTADSEKARIINELRKTKMEPRIELLKYGLDERQALLVEATAIDLLDIKNLTNKMLGHGSSFGARASVAEVVATLDTTEIDITDPVLLINIRKKFRYGMSPMELYDATRSAWKLSKKRKKRLMQVRYAMSVYLGIVREVYEVAAWVPGGMTIRSDDPIGRTPRRDRLEFVGIAAPDNVRKRYTGRSVAKYFAKGSQNPVQYVNCD